MKTRFYKILYKHQQVVYVGVTTRTVAQRFREHIKSKHLNPEIYSAIQFDEIEHPNITSMEEYYNEYHKVKALEQKYIKEELEKGSPLLNISVGGEWGSKILSDILKEQFFETYGSYDGFEKWIKHKRKTKAWLYHWLDVKTRIKTKIWIKQWVYNSLQNKTKNWIKNWIDGKNRNKTKKWLRKWISGRSINKTKYWIKHWIIDRKINKTKKWLRKWISGRSTNKTKVWIRNWINNRSTNKTKKWLRSWIGNNSVNKTKKWLRSWINHRK